MFSEVDVDDSVFTDGNKASNGEEGDELDQLINGLIQQDDGSNSVVRKELRQYDSSTNKKRRLNEVANPTKESPGTGQVVTLDAIWSSEFIPPVRFPNTSCNHLGSAKQEQAFPPTTDLRQLATWQVAADEIPVCCACLEDLWPTEEDDSAIIELESRFSNFLHEDDLARRTRNIGLISSCYHMFHDDCIQKWTQTENACCQCKQRYGLLAIYSPTGERINIQPVKKRLQSLAIREDLYGESPGERHVCHSCHSVGDAQSLMQCRDCDVYAHWYCQNMEAMPSEPWLCPDHRPRAIQQRRVVESQLREITSRSRAPAPAPSRARRNSTRRGRGSATGNAVLFEALQRIRSQNESATWTPNAVIHDAFDVPFDPDATSYAEFHSHRANALSGISKSEISDLLLGDVPECELLGRPTQERVLDITRAVPCESERPLKPSEGLMARSIPTNQSEDSPLTKQIRDHETRAMSYRSRAEWHRVREVHYSRRIASLVAGTLEYADTRKKHDHHEQRATECSKRAFEHEQRAKQLRERGERGIASDMRVTAVAVPRQDRLNAAIAGLQKFAASR